MGKMNIFQLTVGDWSRDGHNQFDVYYITANRNAKFIENLHLKFKEKYDLDFTKECQDYEDTKLSDKMFDKLLELGILEDAFEIKDIEEFSEIEIENLKSLYSEAYVHIYMCICKHMEPELKYKIKDLPNINIGGYGLYF